MKRVMEFEGGISEYRIVIDSCPQYSSSRYAIWKTDEIWKTRSMLFETNFKSELRIWLDLNGLKFGKRYEIFKTMHGLCSRIELEKV